VLPSVVVALAGSVLEWSPPGGPGEQAGQGAFCAEEQGVGEAPEFVDGQRDQACWRGLGVAVGGGGDGKEGVGEHGQETQRRT
jgi:hypothetical protein